MTKNKRQGRTGFSNFGFSTILIVFVMICIVTFSALAYLTASSDYRLSKKVADRTTAYYEAEAVAYQKLEEIDTLLADTYSHTRKKNKYIQAAYHNLTDYAADTPEMTVTHEDALLVSFPVTINSQDTLNVSLQVCYPPDAGGICYRVTCWKTVTELLSEE